MCPCAALPPAPFSRRPPPSYKGRPTRLLEQGMLGHVHVRTCSQDHKTKS